MKFKSVLLAALGLLAAQSCALAGSTVDPTQPPTGGSFTSAPVRNNFLAAYTDINNLLGDFPGSVSPSSPTIGQKWRKTSVTPNLIYQWTGTAWVQVATFDVSGGTVTPYVGNRLLTWQQLVPGLGTNGQCLVFTGTSTNPTAQNCLNSTNFTATAPISASASGANETIGINLDSNFATVGGNLALASTGAGNLIANCGGSSAEPSACSWSAFANQAIGSTNGMFPARFSGTWQAGMLGTGLAFSGTALNLQPASAGAIGGVNSIAAVAHQWINSISTAGLPALSQPAFTDISGQNTLAQLPTIGADTVLGSIAGGTPAALSQAQLTSLINPFTATLNGAVPNPGAATGKVLSDNGTWVSAAGTGTVSSVGSGAGLTGGPITGTGSLSTVPQLYNPVTAAPYNAACNGSTDDSTAIQAAITAATPGSRIDIPGNCFFNTALNFLGKSYITVYGNSLKGTASESSALTYGGTAARAIDLRDTVAIVFKGVNLQWSNASFAGIMTDYGSQTPGTSVSFYGGLQGLSFRPTGSGSTTTVTCANFSEAIEWYIGHNSFDSCEYAIHGETVLGQSTTGLIEANQFFQTNGVPIDQCGEGWTLLNNTFEQLQSGEAGAMTNSSTLPCKGLNFSGNWFGDVTANGGTWLNLSVHGFTFTGNVMSGFSATSNDGIGLTSSIGLNITGNDFSNLTVAVTNFSGTVDGGIVCGNSSHNVTSLTSGLGTNVISSACNATY